MLTKVRRGLRRRKEMVYLYKDALLLLLRTFTFSYEYLGKKVFIIGLYEHIGDVIACEPVIGYLKDVNKDCRVVWAINGAYAELLEAHPGVDKVVHLKSFSQWIILKKLIRAFCFAQSRIIDLHINEKRCQKHKMVLKKMNTEINFNNYLTNRSCLQAFSLSAGLPEINLAPRFYLTPGKKDLKIKKPCIVFHTQSNHILKDWQPGKWLELTKLLINTGYTVVEIGLTKQIDFVDDNFIDYTGKKSLQSIAHIIADACFFVGVDSGFAHLANALNIPGSVLMGDYRVKNLTFVNYNPFTGFYADFGNIIYAPEGKLSLLEPLCVFKRVIEKLPVVKHATYL